MWKRPEIESFTVESVESYEDLAVLTLQTAYCR